MNPYSPGDYSNKNYPMLLMYKQKTTLDGVKILSINEDYNKIVKDFLDILFSLSTLIAFYYWVKMAISDYLNSRKEKHL